MKPVLLFLTLFTTFGMACSSQKNLSFPAGNANAEREVIALSGEKWQWMAGKNVDKLAPTGNYWRCPSAVFATRIKFSAKRLQNNCEALMNGEGFQNHTSELRTFQQL